MRKCNAIAAIIGVFLYLGGDGRSAIGVEIPFAEDFNDDLAPDFTYSTGALVTATVAGGVLTADSAPSTSGQGMNALVNVGNANGMSIKMDTDIKPTAWSNVGGSSTGFLAFSTNPAAGAGPSGANSGYLADIVFPSTANNGYIRLYDLASPVATATLIQSPFFAVSSLALDETYHLTFTATPGLLGVLNLSLTITDTTGTLIDEDGIVTISASTPAAASTGTFFGYRQRVGAGGSGVARTFDAVYDNFSIAAGLPGDFNTDGVVDAADYVIWRKDPTTVGGGDPAGYNLWRENFGNPPADGSSLSSSTTVPEPSMICMVAIGAVAALSRRRAARTLAVI